MTLEGAEKEPVLRSRPSAPQKPVKQSSTPAGRSLVLSCQHTVSRSPFLLIIPTTPAWLHPPSADAPARSWVTQASNADTGRSFLSSPAAGTNTFLKILVQPPSRLLRGSKATVPGPAATSQSPSHR